MSKYFNKREIELLAPVGTYEDFESLLNSGADAFYLGGKNFNMRMHKKDHNFTDRELEKAVTMAHKLEKKVYITVNNMMSSDEIKMSLPFLRYLETIQPDALIIQDYGLVKLIRDNGLKLNMHLSVMANVHNLATIKLVKDLGISRIVASRELSLHTLSSFIKELPEMEYEYFIHGDMCAVHGAQCYYGGMLFGKSSNRGLCMKPCRWPYMSGDNNKSYDLAVKDISLYRHIPELIQSGVNSYKIEGRMRGSDYLVSIINSYREAIDRYIDDPMGYYTNEDVSKMFYENRVRNLSTAYAFKKPGFSNVDIKGEREPRVFSRAVEEADISEESIKALKERLACDNIDLTIDNDVAVKPRICVKVNSLEAFKEACDCGADMIYIAGEVFRPNHSFTKYELIEAMQYKKHQKIYYALPKMAYDRQFSELNFLVPELKKMGFDGIVIGNLGELGAYFDKEFEIRGDYNLNIYNEAAASFYREQGLSGVTLSIEAPISVIKSTVLNTDVSCELIVQGAPDVMYLEHCLMAAKHNQTSEDFCKSYCSNDPFELIDEKGNSHRVFADQYCKNHIISTKDICYLPILLELFKLGVDTFRIEGQHYQPKQLGQVVKLYRDIIDKITETDINYMDSIDKLIKITNRRQSLQALNY